MEVTYNFANGENVIVLVDEKLGDTIMQLDKDLYNNNQKETRRHKNLSELLDKTRTTSDFLIFPELYRFPATAIAVRVLPHPISTSCATPRQFFELL